MEYLIWVAFIILIVLACMVATPRDSGQASNPKSVTRAPLPDIRVEQAAPNPEPTRIYVEMLSCDLSATGHESWRSLLNMKLGDAKGARDLVLMERHKNPNDDVEALINRAIERWRRDINR